MTSDPFPATYSDRVRKIGVVNTKNKLLTAVAGALLDGPAALRSYLIRNVITEGFAFEDVMARRRGAARRSCARRRSACGMPPAAAAWAPTATRWPSPTPQGRVRGVEGLRVVDASIFPLVPCANTNFPTLMTAEKIADAIVQEGR